MSDHLVDVRVPLAVSPHARVELAQDGVLHVIALAGVISLQLDRASCEELTTTLARAMVTLAKSQPKASRPQLSLVRHQNHQDRHEDRHEDQEPMLVQLVQQENRP
jgi:hypothetical protein